MILLLQHQRPDGEVDTYHLKPGRRYHIGRGSACEVRILDLKLSRKHCAIEYGDGAWNIIDLLSTNGCKLDGEQIVGTIPLGVGANIEAGQTVLTVAQVGEAAGDHKELHGDEDVAGHDHTDTARPLVQEALPEDGTGSAAAEKQDDDSNVWEPEPEADPLNKTDALMPNRKPGSAPPASARPSRGAAGAAKGAEPRRPTAVFRAGDQVDVDHDSDPTQKHLQDAAPLAGTPPREEAPPPAAAPPIQDAPATKPPTAEERAFYITVLGRRVGPLTRAVARELKARELRGSLTTADLEGYPLA